MPIGYKPFTVHYLREGVGGTMQVNARDQAEARKSVGNQIGANGHVAAVHPQGSYPQTRNGKCQRCAWSDGKRTKP